MIDDEDIEEDEKTIVPLPNVNSAILRRILQSAHYHKNDDESKMIDDFLEC